MTSYLASRPLSEAASPPRPEELEISLFGKGVGESLVVHLGDGDWMVVDSFVDRQTGRPVALDYLTRLGLSPEKVLRHIVISHWHDDHTSGASALLDNAPAAQVFLSAAFNKKEVRKLLAASECRTVTPTGVDEMALLLRNLLARKRANSGGVQLNYLLAKTLVHKSSRSEVFALSPSSGTLTRALAEIVPFLPVGGGPKRRVSHEPNDLSVVLHVAFPPVAVLLGADLEVRTDSSTGWLAVVGLAGKFCKSGTFKVAHHGSPNADHPQIWNELLTPSPVAILTPFLAGRKPLPSHEDLLRLKSTSIRVLCAGSPAPAKSRDLAPEAQKMVRASGASIRQSEGAVGHVRLRIDGSGRTMVDLFGAAVEL